MAERKRIGTERAQQAGQLSVDATATDGIHVLALAGEIDHHTGNTLRQALTVPIEDCPRIVADLRQVTFMDSSGINIFLTAHRALSEAGGWLRLAAPREAVMRTLSLIGADAVIDCRETLRQALNN
ncbi:STAS domain-containing protein [Streptomyces sp. NPDC002952]|uniref:STAS domain-containing protein n=1 Tax=Streptomyces sp. NPDC002952 TaxID=3364673 RepID=UPI0036C0D0E5